MSSILYEKLLLYRIRTGGDPEAFGKIYDLYVQRIYRFVYFKVQSTEEAQDVTAETFLKLWQHVKTGKGVRHLGALLYEIARNTIVDQHRSAHPTEATDDALAQSVQDMIGLARMQRSAEVSMVFGVLRLLKDEYREVLVMRYVDGMSTREIATLLKKNPGAVRVLLHRSLATLRALLAPSSESETTKETSDV